MIFSQKESLTLKIWLQNNTGGPQDVMSQAVKIFAAGAVSFLNATEEVGGKLDYKLSCSSNKTRYVWGDTFLK